MDAHATATGLPVPGYELFPTPEGEVARIRVRGNALLATPMINRGTAFTLDERRALGLVGLLPSGVTTIDEQARRVYAMYERQGSDLAKNVFLANLKSRNEVLFYRLLADYVGEMLPIVYTPTVGEAIQRYSHEYRRPRGVYLSIDRPEEIEPAFRNYGLGADDVDLLVATDSEGILGIGDWGVGGIEIAVGKLMVYVAAGGAHPRRVIPVVLDTGTDNPELLNDELYLGERHPRVRGAAYDEFLEAYVETATRLFPNALLHWEDFGADNARRLLDRYAERVRTFNDDVQGTAAVVLAAVLSGVRVAGTRLRDARVVIHGAGTAGLGIADMLRAAMVRDGLDAGEALRRIYPLGRNGLLVVGQQLRDFQQPYARSAEEVAAWRGPDSRLGLAEVVRGVQPTVLIGTSTQPGAFNEEIVTAMAAPVERPIILPLSNPTSLSEAVPADLLAWTNGRALVATGSPFPPVERGGTTYHIAQANNALVFPGLGLGVTVSRAGRVTDGMLTAAADAVASLASNGGSGAALLPPIDDLRRVTSAVAAAVARSAAEEGVARRLLPDLDEQVDRAMWRPTYPTISVV
jgi:malate dehydrogenase (oxaloacetate-decarboxylating)